jgi:DNA-directed RNA polymerase
LFEKFYFPHNVDFRGRAYPIPPNLNHIGDDLSRGLLMFDEAKPLGEHGLRWLKIHCANLAGYDKASFAERVAFIDEHIEDVFDSADKPLEVRGPQQHPHSNTDENRVGDGGSRPKIRGSALLPAFPSQKH